MSLRTLIGFTLLLSACGTVHGQYSTLWEAVYALNLGSWQFLLTLDPKMTSMFQDPNTSAIFLLPKNNTDFAYDYPWGWTLVNQKQVQYLTYYMIPSDIPQAYLNLTGGDLVLNTGFPASPNVTTTLTIKRIGDSTSTQAVAAAIGPGGVFDYTLTYTAGKSRIYLVDNPLLPPNLGLPTPKMAGLSIASALLHGMDPQDANRMSDLIQADPVMLEYLSSPDVVVTLFIPQSAALEQYIQSLGLSLDQFKGSAAARMLIQSHILPDRAYTLRVFPKGTSAKLTMAPNTYVLINSQPAVVPTTVSTPAVDIRGLNNIQPRSVLVDRSNVWGGKSVIHVINGVILVPPPPPAPPIPPAIPKPPPAVVRAPTQSPILVGLNAPIAPPLATSSEDSKKDNIGPIVGGVVGGVVALALLAALLGVLMARRRKSKEAEKALGSHKTGATRSAHGSAAGDANGYGYRGFQVYVDAGTASPDAHKTPPLTPASSTKRSKGPMQIQGFIFGDPFVRSAAPQYSWTEVSPDSPSMPGVEAGINDALLDKMAPQHGGYPPVLRLSRTDIVNEIKLLNCGPLGRGASAIVFKCTWESRFGPNAMLAVKVLKDPYEADPAVFESFCYEAAVLASVKHPSVVRMYGYCLELPTACIIMELCPGTLRDRLYRRLPDSSRSNTQSNGNRDLSQTATTQRSRRHNQGPLRSAVTVQQPPPSTSRSTSAPSQSGSSETHSESAPVAPTNQSMSELHPPQAAGSTGLDSGPAAPATPKEGEGNLPVTQRSDSQQSIINTVPAASNMDTAVTGAGTTTTTATATTTSKPVQYLSLYNHLPMAEVLQLISDVAAGLAYLHKRPAVMSLPVHPTAMLENPLSDSDDGSSTLPPATPHTMVIEEEEDEEEAKSVARIVHRDLKPSNILINSQGRCKISDFGLARWHNNTSVHTNTLGVGTLRYMAPELLLGHFAVQMDPHITNRVDIYSLGMLLWELAAAQMPWSDLTDAQIVAAVISQKRPALEGVPMEQHQPPAHVSGDAALLAMMRTHYLNTATTLGHEEGPALPELPASLADFPELMTIINLCWAPAAAKRPTARVVHRALCTLLMSYGQRQQ